jgi:hypothetical protein
MNICEKHGSFLGYPKCPQCLDERVTALLYSKNMAVLIVNKMLSKFDGKHCFICKSMETIGSEYPCANCKNMSNFSSPE